MSVDGKFLGSKSSLDYDGLMDYLYDFLMSHANSVHWLIFGLILLAGLNFPISIDIVVILSAFIAARVLPQHRAEIYFSLLLGCYFSAWIAYSIGRFLGPYVTRIPFISKVLSQERLDKARLFYEKQGGWALVLGRFIPFGVRNCLFMSAGISKVPFRKFITLDAFACLIWCSSTFFLFYSLGSNYESLIRSVKLFNIILFGAFCVTVIGIIWYKKRKKSISHDKSVQ